MNVEDYLARLTSKHSDKPKFVATVRDTLQPFVDARLLLQALPSYFDLDTAIGAQLDVVGQWVNLSRIIATPIPDPWFRLDDVRRGFDVGLWYQPFDTETFLTALDDETFRRLIRARIAALHWDGSSSDALRILRLFFLPDPLQANTGAFSLEFSVDFHKKSTSIGDFGFEFSEAFSPGAKSAEWKIPTVIVVDDKDDMTAIIAISRKLPGAVDLEIFGGDYLPLDAAGVEVTKLVVSIDEAPIFGFDASNDVIGGFDEGALGVPPRYAIENLILL